MKWRAIGIAMFLMCPLSASAQFSGPGQYPQFRGLSGLGGGGYGVNVEGYSSLAGPTAYSTPVAYVLGHGQWRLLNGAVSMDSLPRTGNSTSNGTGVITYGQTVGRFNLAATYLIKSGHGDSSYNLQAQYIPAPGTPWTVSVGVQDLLGHGGAAGEGVPGDGLSSRSLFGVVTCQIPLQRRPLFLSVGVGTHRFGRLFGSMSYQVARSWRLWMEQDGFGINTGLLLTVPLHHHRGPEFTANIGMLRGRYFALSGGIGF